MKNIATVGETTPEVEIPTGKPQVESNKAVGDANGDGYATPGEVLNYTLSAINKGKVTAENIIIKDDLSDVIDHVDTSSTVVTLNNDGNITTHTLAELQSGITVSLASGKELSVTFSVTVKTDLDVSTVTSLKNIATVGETTPEVEIPTGKPLIESDKAVADANGDGFAAPGEVLNYTLTAANKGDIIADALLMKDDLSSILAHVDVLDTDKVTVSIDGVETGTYTIADLKSGFSIVLKPGETVTVSFSVTVKADLDVSTVTTLKNIATVGETTPEVEIPTGKPQVESNKAVVDANGDGYATPGEVLNYSISAINKGKVTAENIIIRDDLSGVINHVDTSNTVVTLNNDGNITTHTLAELQSGITVSLASGKELTVSFSVTVKSDLDVSTVTSLKNIATVGETTPEVEIPTGKPLIESNKAVVDANGDGYATPGEVLNYILTATNKGDIIADALFIKDDLSSILTHVDVLDTDKVTVNINGVKTGTYTIADLKSGFNIVLKPGETVKVNFSVTVKADLDVATVTTLKNIATIGETTPEVEIPTGKPLIESNKTVVDANGDGYATPGEGLDYTLTATNMGDIIADSLLIKDDLVNVQPYVNVSDSDKVTVSINDVEIGSYTIADLKSGFNIVLKPGETVKVSFTVTVKADLDVSTVTNLRNIATVGETTPEVEIPTGKPLVESNKVVVDANGDGYATPGEVLNYVLTATNKGDIIADSLLIKDDLANVQPYVNVSNSDKVTVSINNVETGSYTIADLKSGFNIVLKPGETVKVSFKVTVKSDLDVSKVVSIKNIATIGETTPEVEIPTGKPDTVAHLEVVDTDGDGYVSPGEDFVYALYIENKSDKVTDSNLLIRDTQESISKIVKQLDGIEVTVNIDGVITVITMEEFMNGFEIDLGPNSKVVITFTVTAIDTLDVIAIPQIDKTAQVGTLYPSASIETGDSLISSDKAVTDSNGDGYAAPGEILSYTITANNSGLVAAHDFMIKDDLASLLAHIENPLNNNVIVNNNGQITTYLLSELKEGIVLDVAPKSTVTVDFDVKVREDLDLGTVVSIRNKATVGETTPEVEIPVSDVNLVSEKTVTDKNSNGLAAPGELLSYTISIINKGNATANNVFIQDTLENVLPYVENIDNTLVTVTNGEDVFTAPLKDLVLGFNLNIKSGVKVTISFSVKVRNDIHDLGAVEIRNVAQVGDNTPEVTIPVEPQPVEKLPGAGLGNEILNLSMFSVTLGSVLLFLSPFRRRKQKQN